MIREFTEQLKVISHSPVKVYLASYINRYWYPYRLQHAGKAKTWLQDESLETILDSGISDEEIGNRETLDTAHEANADYVVPADVLHNRAQTTEAVREFMRMYESHPCRAKPLVPLQPPHEKHYQELSGFSHYVLGGLATAGPQEQLKAIRAFRDVAGYGVYAHGLGLGASLTLVRALRENPRLLDSFDLSTNEQVVIGEKIPDKSWSQQDFKYPRGENSSTVRAQYAKAVALQLNYMLGPFCEDQSVTSTWEQSNLVQSVAAADGGTLDAEGGGVGE